LPAKCIFAGREREAREEVRAKDYRTAGQGGFQEKAQYVVFIRLSGHNMLSRLPTIPGKFPKIPDVLRTTADEKGLTLGQTR
jgi:hypothetical protein